VRGNDKHAVERKRTSEIKKRLGRGLGLGARVRMMRQRLEGPPVRGRRTGIARRGFEVSVV
jgi:hypothetical protein